VTLAAAAVEQDTFAANRASGRIALAVAAARGRTLRRQVHESGSLRVRFPNADAGLEAVLVNTGGGITGGDRFTIDVDVGEGAQLLVSTAAAEKIYRSTGPDAEIAVRLAARAGARLAWLPQETILFDRARLARRIDIELDENASLLLAEAVVFGRTAMGEALNEGAWRDSWRLRRAGKLVFAESVRLDGAIAELLARPAVANGGVALATLLIAPAEESLLARLREVALISEGGISAWNGIAVARLCARDAAALRQDMLALVAALGERVPRLWLQ
jgi:urease accessory protein